MSRTFVQILFILITIHSTSFLFSDSNRYGGKFILSTTSDPKTFNPIIAKETSSTAITSLIFDGLTTMDPFTLEILPNLAKSWEMDDSGTKWIFYLREDILWSDGKPFGAGDVVFTFNELIFNTTIFSSARDIFMINGKPFGVKALDSHTVQIDLPQPFAPFLMMMAGQDIVPKHRLKKYVDEGTFNAAWNIDTAPKDIVGTGPFVLGKYESGERIILEKNPTYWKKTDDGDALPYLDKVIFMVLQNIDMTVLRFQEGSLDYISLRGSDFPIIKPLEKKKNFTVYRLGPAFGETFLVFNQNLGKKEDGSGYIPAWKLKLFRNKKFRQAISYALDRKSMVNILMNGLGFVQFSPMSSAAINFYNENVKTYDYDPKKSKEILNEIGLLDRDQNSVLEDSDGHEISFAIITNADNTQRVQAAQMIRKDLERVGLKANIVSLEFNTLVSRLNATFDWEGIILGLTGGVEPHFGRNVWHSSGQLHLWYPMQPTPSTEWEKRIDEIFDQGVMEMDPKKRKALYDEWQVLASENLPLIYTVQAERIFAIKNKFGNLKPTVNGGAIHNIEEIYLEESVKR